MAMDRFSIILRDPKGDGIHILRTTLFYNQVLKPSITIIRPSKSIKIKAALRYKNDAKNTYFDIKNQMFNRHKICLTKLSHTIIFIKMQSKRHQSVIENCCH